MATDQRTLPAYFSVNTDFQTWCQGLAAQLVAAGMVKTADTGQINNTTVAKPSGGNTAAGYEIYRFTDTAVTNGQTSNPILLKVEYGSGGTADRPSLWLTVGTGSDGAGNITGPTMTRTQYYPNVSYVAGATLVSYCCGDGGRLILSTNNDPSNNSAAFGFAIDRIRDSTGAPTGEGFVSVRWRGDTAGTDVRSVLGAAAFLNTQGFSTQSPFLGPAAPLSMGSILFGTGGGLLANGNNVGVMPMIVVHGQVRFLSVGVIYDSTVFGSLAGQTFTATNFGASHTYLTLGGTNNNQNQIAGVLKAQIAIANGSNNSVLAMLWE